jgi:hypothetical protein
MAKHPQRRRVPRVRLPAPLSGRTLGILSFYLVDLSVLGARIEHTDPLRPGSSWALELPIPLGGPVLSGQVVWSRVIEEKQTPGGDQSHRYQSGLLFTALTGDQQAELARIVQQITTQGGVVEDPEPPKKRRRQD